MTTGEPPKAMKDADLLDRLRRDVAEWQRHGIITPEQGAAIFAYYQVPPEALRARRLYARLIAVLATLGAILVGVGAILFVASNWQGIPNIARLALILSTIAATYTVGYWLKYHRGYPRIGVAVIFLATMFYGAAIFLVGQLYHMRVDDPNLLIWWFLGVLPLAYLTRSRAILSLAIVAALGGLGWKAASWLENVSASETFLFALYLFLGPLLYALGMLHARFSRTSYYAAPYHAIGMLTTLFAMYLFSFEGTIDEALYSYHGRPEVPGAFLATTAIAAGVAVVSGAASLAVSAYRREDRRMPLAETAAVAIALGIAYLIMFVPFDSVTTYTALVNLVLFATIVGAIVAGILTRRGALVNLGMLFFAIDALTRYADIMWGMLDTSLFFILGGMLLLGGGFLLERARRRLMLRFHLVEVHDEE